IERSDKAKNWFSVKRKFLDQVGSPRSGLKPVDIHTVRHYLNACWWDAPADKILTHTFANGYHLVRLLKQKGLQGPAQPITDRSFLEGTVVDGGIFPKRSRFVKERNG